MHEKFSACRIRLQWSMERKRLGMLQRARADRKEAALQFLAWR